MPLSIVERRRESPPRQVRRMCTASLDAYKVQQPTRPQDPWLMSAMIKLITSQLSQTREGSDFAQKYKQQSTAQNVVFVCASSLGKIPATAFKHSIKK